ncbi:MAG: GntR family transcriptional regulator [Deltaproteobacteria bacterium]|nr:GntR family transcriptional regulator [Deltaproteobacteria bacterium]
MNLKSDGNGKKTGRKEEKSRAVKDAFNAIKNMLYFKELAPGQRLVYGDLAKKLNMSLTPVIQALNKLEHSELVYYEPNKGYYVGEINEKEVRELYQAREALEVVIIPSIIKNISKEDLDSIKDSIARYEKTLSTVETRRLQMLKDMQFHLKIAEYSHQTVIQNMLRGLAERLALKYRPVYLGDERINNAVREHRRIFRAFEQKDVKEAIAATRDHNKSSVEHIINSLERTVTKLF